MVGSCVFVSPTFNNQAVWVHSHSESTVNNRWYNPNVYFEKNICTHSAQGRVVKFRLETLARINVTCDERAGGNDDVKDRSAVRFT